MKEHRRSYFLRVYQSCSNDEGFSIISMIMAAGMMAGLALTLAELTKQQMAIQVKIETAVELVNLSRRISRALYDGESCKNTIGSTIVFNISSTVQSFPIDFIRDKENNSIIEKGGKYGNNMIKVNSMKLEVPKIENNSFEAKFIVVFQKIKKAIKGHNLVTREYPLSLESDTDGTLLGCNSSFDATARLVKRQLCNELGGTWDPVNYTCTRNAGGVSKASCPAGYLVKGINAEGKLLCASSIGCRVHANCVASFEAVDTTPFCSESEYLSRTQNYESRCKVVSSCTGSAKKRSILLLGTRPTSSPIYKEYDHFLDVAGLHEEYSNPETWKIPGVGCKKHSIKGTYSSSYLKLCCR